MRDENTKQTSYHVKDRVYDMKDKLTMINFDDNQNDKEIKIKHRKQKKILINLNGLQKFEM